MKYKKLTLEDHIELAAKLREIVRLLQEIANIIQDKLPRSSNIHRLMLKCFLGIRGEFRSNLDNEYHSIIDDSTFKKLGNIYYNFNQKI